MYELVLCHSFMPCHFGHGFAQDGVGHQLVRCGDWLINVFRRHQKTCLFRPFKASTRVATTGTPLTVKVNFKALVDTDKK